MSAYKISASVSEDKGKIRNNNEDNFYLNGQHLNRENREQSNTFDDMATNKINVYAVFDGMGGEELGEDASLIAAEVTKKFHSKINRGIIDNVEKQILLSISEANQRICQKMQENGKKRIGATYTALVVDNGVAQIYNIGDSRVYLIREGKLKQLSIDDTTAQRLVNIGMISEEMAKTHPDRHRLTQHLGIFEHEMIIEPHISHSFKVMNGDKFLLCSDGLTDMVEDCDIEKILNSSNNETYISQMLVSKALENGGKDNVTAMVVCVKEANETVLRVKKNNILPSLLIIFTCVALAACTVIYFLKRSEPHKRTPVAISDIRLDDSLEIVVGEDITIDVVNITEHTKFMSSDETVAIVGKNGVIHGIKAGKTKISVVSGRICKTIEVIVGADTAE